MTTELKTRLEAILAECDRALALAEKATPNKWSVRKNYFDRNEPSKYALASPMPSDWQPDEFAQQSPDYTGNPGVSSTRKRSGKRTKEAKTAATLRWRRRNASRYRAYMRRYMANRRSGSPEMSQTGHSEG